MLGKFELVERLDGGYSRFKCDSCGQEKVVKEKYLEHNNCKCFTADFIFEKYNHVDDIEILRILKNAPKKKDVSLEIKCTICGQIRVINIKDIENRVRTNHFKSCDNSNLKSIIYEEIEFKSTQYKNYFVSKCGQVLSINNGTPIIMNHDLGGCGHHRVPLKINKKEKKILVHRMVYETWKEPILEGNVIDHIDANPHNNNLDNLRQCTQKENIHHAIENGNFGKNSSKRVVIRRKSDNEILTFESVSDLANFIGKPQSNGGSRFLNRSYFTDNYVLISKDFKGSIYDLNNGIIADSHD